MYQTHYIDGLKKLNEEILIEPVRNPDDLQEAYRLRYTTYCVDHAYLDGSDGLEYDEFDAYSMHANLRSRRTGLLVGTVRIIIADALPDTLALPFEQMTNGAGLPRFPQGAVCEVSRFTLVKDRVEQIRLEDPSVARLLRLALLRAALSLSAECGMSHWAAVMAPSLLRLLRREGLEFTPIGQLVDYHGYRQPVIADLRELLAGVRREHPGVWNYLTEDGTNKLVWTSWTGQLGRSAAHPGKDMLVSAHSRSLRLDDGVRYGGGNEGDPGLYPHWRDSAHCRSAELEPLLA